MPSWESFHVSGLKLRKEELAAYQEVAATVFRAQLPGPRHRLLGHPDQVQGDMLMECEIVSQGFAQCDHTYGRGGSRFRERASSWRLLLQLDSDDTAAFGFPYGAQGLLYFWIREMDLQERRFESTWALMQWS